MALLFQTLITKMLRLQVKASSFILQKGKRTPCYHFQLGSGSNNKKKPNNTKDWSTMTSWLYVALNTVTAYSFTSVKSTSSAKRLAGHHFYCGKRSRHLGGCCRNCEASKAMNKDALREELAEDEGCKYVIYFDHSRTPNLWNRPLD